MGYSPGYGRVAEDYFKNLPQGTVTSGGNQRLNASNPTKTPSTGRQYDQYGVPVVPGSPLRREPNLDQFQQPAYEGGMEALMQLLKKEGDTSGLIGQSESTLSDILGGVDPAKTESMFREKYLPSQRRTFEEETLPGIREAMVGAGDFWSTGRASLEAKANESFAERMESQLADLQRENRQSAQSALSNVGDISGMKQRQEMDRIRNLLPFLNLPTQTSYLEPESGGRGGEGEVNGRMTNDLSGRLNAGGGFLPPGGKWTQRTVPGAGIKFGF